MASIVVNGDRLVLELSATERVLGLLPDNPSVPLASVRSAHAVRPVRKAIRGIRAPGLGAPGVAWIGHWRGRGHDLVAVYGNHAGVVVELDGAPYERFVVSLDDPDAVVSEIEAAKAA